MNVWLPPGLQFVHPCSAVIGILPGDNERIGVRKRAFPDRGRTRPRRRFEVNATPNLLPYEKSWWTRPWTDIAMELARSPFVGIGVDRLAEGGSLKVPTIGMAMQAVGAAMYGVKGLRDILSGDKVNAETNIRAAIRDGAGAFGQWGRVINNFITPPMRQTTHDIRKAANEVGLQFTPPKASAGFGFMNNTPTRLPLLAASLALEHARTSEEKQAASERLQTVARSIYQSAYDSVIEKGGFASEFEAKKTADQAGRRAIQSALSAIEPVTRALGRSLTRKEFDELKGTGVLDDATVQDERNAVIRNGTRSLVAMTALLLLPERLRIEPNSSSCNV